MAGLTDFITEYDWAEIALIWYVLVDDTYQALERRFGKWRKRGPQPEFIDSEVITVSLLIDTYWHGNEEYGLAHLRRYQPGLFPKLLPNGQFNYRRRLLGPIIEQIRRYLQASWGLFDPDDDLRIVDSAPVVVCTYKRARQNANFAGPEYFGKMYTKAAHFFGFRLHVSVNDQQMVENWLLAPAAHHDSQLVWPLMAEQDHLTILGDGAYLSPIENSRLADKRHSLVIAPPRRDSRTTKWPRHCKQVFNRLRRNVESAFSVLSDVFNIEKPGSHSTDGLVTRTASRLLAYSLCFITNFILAGAI